jgi:serine/threonine protein kinase
MSDSLYPRYELGVVIGSGASGNVFRATHRLTKVEVAIKVIPKTLLEKPSNLSRFQAEVKLLKQINHPRIIRYFELIESPTAWYLVTELATKGDLLTMINRGKSGLSEQQVRSVFTELLQAVTYLHEQCHIVHRDLKPENILIDRNDHIRIIDFGFAKLFTDPTDVFTSRCGSPAYVAPEIVTSMRYTTTVDVWSLGVILYAMAVGQLPFEGDTVEAQLRRIVYSTPQFPTMNTDLRGLLIRMLDKNGDSRISLAEIWEHPWMAGTVRKTLFVQPSINRVAIQKLAGQGLFVREFNIGMDSEEAIAYRMLEREEWIRSEWKGQPMPVKVLLLPIVASSAMAPSRGMPKNLPHRRQGRASENEAERVNIESLYKRQETSRAVRSRGRRTSVVSLRITGGK